MEPQIVGRDTEIALIASFVAEHGDTPKAMLIEGEAGTGKSALWEYAVAVAARAGWRVLASRASEAESHLSHATLTDLVGPVWPDVAGSLAGPQHRALGGALLMVEAGRDPDPRTAGTAVVTALATLAAERRVLVAIDDAPWADEASDAVLRFALRRLPEGVAVVATARGEAGHEVPLSLDQIPGRRLVRVRPGPLSVASLHHLTRVALGRPLPRPALVEVARVSAGNPLVALELGRVWASDTRPQMGDEASIERLPLSERLTRLALERIATMSAGARAIATLAALMARSTIAELVAAAGVSATDAIDEAVSTGVLVVDGPRVRFAHPILAAALTDRLPPGRRRELHGVLARVSASVEERGHHLAASVEVPDAETAAAIEEAADSAAAHAAPTSAAFLYRAAIRLTPPTDQESIARREVGAAMALAAVGDTDAARAALGSAAARTTSVVTAVSAAMFDADLAWADGRLHQAHDRLTEAASLAGGDPPLRARVHARLAAYTLPLDVDRARTYAELAASALDSQEAPRAVGYVRINQFIAEVLAGAAPRRDLLDEGLRLERTGELDAAPSAVPLLWYNAIDDVGSARARHDQEDAWYRARGDDGWRAERMAHRALTELRAGEWQLAESLADEACGVVEQFERRGAWWTAFAWRSLVDAYRGRAERAISTLEPLVAAARERENLQWAGLMLSVLGFARFASGDLEGADAAVVDMHAAFGSIGHREPIGDRSEIFHVEALVALGEIGRAEDVVARLEVRGSRIARPWIDVTLPRARALVLQARGEVATAIDVLRAAPRSPTDAPSLPFDHAWNDLVLGRLLRRAKQKHLAADVLRLAAARFDALGAPGWAAAARQELSRVGLRHVARDALSETERRVAELAAAGLRNREIAAAAFLSEKTVEANLTRVYQKLGIRSRAELGTRLGRSRGEGQT